MAEDDDNLLGKLRGLLIYVEQLAAEMRDPLTSSRRRDEIRDELRQWLEALREFER